MYNRDMTEARQIEFENPSGSEDEWLEWYRMTDSLIEAERVLAGMTRAEKAQVLQSVARDLGDAFPGIESVPGGGTACRPTLAGQSTGEVNSLRADPCTIWKRARRPHTTERVP
jgi:hypothetical protein